MYFNPDYKLKDKPKVRKKSRKLYLRQEDWDFRKVTKANLHNAIRYEYARSTDWVKEAFSNWHSQKIELPNESKDFRNWNGRKVEDVLNHLAADGLLPTDVITALLDSLPETFELLDDILIDIGHFQCSTPFVELQVVQYEDEHLRFFNRQNRAFRALVPEKHLFSQLLKMHQTEQKRASNRWLVLGEVNLSDGKTKVVRDFKKWLDTLPPFKIPMGKERNPPWTQLKDLAAYRLSKIGGLTYEQATAEAKKVSKTTPCQKSPNVLPIYNGVGAYSEAVARATARIKRLFPPPYQLEASD